MISDINLAAIFVIAVLGIAGFGAMFFYDAWGAAQSTRREAEAKRRWLEAEKDLNRQREAQRQQEAAFYARRAAANAALPADGFRYPLINRSSGNQPRWLLFKTPGPLEEPLRAGYRETTYILVQELDFVGPIVETAVWIGLPGDGQFVTNDDRGNMRFELEYVDQLFRFPYQTANFSAWTAGEIDAAAEQALLQVRAKHPPNRHRFYQMLTDFTRQYYLQKLEEEDWVRSPALMRDVIQRWRAADSALSAQYQKKVSQLLDWLDDGVFRLDFHALEGDGRALLLPRAIMLAVGKDFARLDLQRSSADLKSLVYVQHRAAIDLTSWNTKLPQIELYLGGKWSLTALDGTSIRLARRPDLAAVVPFQQDYLERGKVFMGLDMISGEPFHVPLAKLSHVLVGGQSGAGKSVLLNQVMRSFLANLSAIQDITLIDLKRVELARYRDLSPKIRLVTRYEELPDIVQGLVDDMYARFDAMAAAGEVNTRSNFRIVIIDEFATIQQRPVAKAERDKHAALIANLNLLSQLARAAGIKIWAQLQKPTADNMDTSFRTNLQSVACFMMPAKINAAAMFGEIDGLPADPTKLGKGEFVFRDDASGRTVLLKSTFCDENDVAGLRASMHSLPPAIAESLARLAGRSKEPSS